jgi:hypothetical protein
MATVFEPIRPVPPMMTIFMIYPPFRRLERPFAPLCSAMAFSQNAAVDQRRDRLKPLRHKSSLAHPFGLARGNAQGDRLQG